MTYLPAAMIVVATLTTLNLILLAAVVRRLKYHQAALGALVPDQGPPTLGIKAGERAPQPVLPAEDGDSDTSPTFAGRTTLIAFLSTSCSACKECLPALRQRLQQLSDDGDQAIAVVCGDGSEAERYAGSLRDVGRLVIEREFGGPVTSAFGVSFFPAYALIGPDGIVLQTGLLQDHLAAATAGARG